MKPSWYSITARADAVEISIYEEIGFFGISAKSFLDELKAVGSRPIVLRINSPGGSVFEGLAIYNRLREHTAGVTVKIDGIAASMAGVIALAGQRVEMAENALYMIHNPAGIAVGDEAEMRLYAELLAKVKESILHAYEAKTGQPRNKLAKMMDAETWLTAQEALDLGFVDAVTEPFALAARFDSARLPNLPAHLAATLTNRPTMKILNASIIALLASTSGLPVTAESTEDEIQNAIAAIGEINARSASAVTALTAERDGLKAQFDELVASTVPLKESVASLTKERDGLTGEIAAASVKLVNATASISRLEALCSVKGVNRDAAPPALASGSDTGSPSEQYVAAVAAGDHGKRRKLLDAHYDEIYAALAARRG